MNSTSKCREVTLEEHLIEIASEWRKVNPSSVQGVVLIFVEEGLTCAYGWKNCLRDPQDEKPGVFAVDIDGIIYQAEGGNDYDGAQRWVRFDACDSYKHRLFSLHPSTQL